jgi:hypothetical protein
MPRSVAVLTDEAREKLRAPLGDFVGAGDGDRLAAVRVFLSGSVSDGDRWMLRSAGLDIPTRGSVPREVDAELSAADLADLAAMPVVLGLESRGAAEAAAADGRPVADGAPATAPATAAAPAPLAGPPGMGVVQGLPADGWRAVFAGDGPDAGTRGVPLVCWAVLRGVDGVGAVHGMVAEGGSVVPAPTVPRFLSYRAPDALDAGKPPRGGARRPAHAPERA